MGEHRGASGEGGVKAQVGGRTGVGLVKRAGEEGTGPGQGSQVQGPGAARRAGAVQGEQCAGAGIGKCELGWGVGWPALGAAVSWGHEVGDWGTLRASARASNLKEHLSFPACRMGAVTKVPPFQDCGGIK